MRFVLNDEQSMICEQVRSFARAELASLPASFEEKETLPKQAVSSLAELGLLGFCVPEAYGGPAADPLSLVHALREIAAVDASLATIVALQNGFVVPQLLQADDEDRKRTLLSGLVEGKWWLAWAGPSPDETSPVQCTPHDGGWSLTGTQRFVSLASSAAHLLVCATSPEGDRHTFLVDTPQEGCRVEAVQNKLGLRAVELGHLHLSSLTLPPEQALHAKPQSAEQHAHIWRRGRLLLAAVSVGVAQAAFAHASQYAQQRKQFGKPLAAFQAIQWKIADLAMQIDAAALLLDDAALAWQQKDEEALEVASRSAALFAAPLAVFAGQESIQIHGGYGFTSEFPVERLYRDAKALCARWEPQAHHQRALAYTWEMLKR